MLVEVNLLPEKNKRDITYPLISLFSLICLTVGVAALFSYQHLLSQDIVAVEEKTYEVKIKSAEIRQNLTGTEKTDYELLDQAVVYLEKYRVPVSLLLEHLVMNLPERGFIQTFDYKLPGEVKLTVSFDQIEEIAQYNHVLEQSSVVSSVSLSIIDTNQVIEELDFLNNVDVLPRYVANFELIINRSEVQKLGDSS